MFQFYSVVPVDVMLVFQPFFFNYYVGCLYLFIFLKIIIFKEIYSASFPQTSPGRTWIWSFSMLLLPIEPPHAGFLNHHMQDFWITASMISYSSIEPQLLPCAPPCGYKFHTLEVHLHPIFTVPFEFEAHLESTQKSVAVLSCENSQCFSVIDNFFRRAPSLMLDRILNSRYSFQYLSVACRWSEEKLPHLWLHKGILDSPCFLILLFTQKTKTTKWNLGLSPRPCLFE